MRLVEFCKKNRWHYSEIAREVGYHPNHLRQIASGKAKCSRRFAKVLEAFTRGEVTVDEILSEYKDSTDNQEQE